MNLSKRTSQGWPGRRSLSNRGVSVSAFSVIDVAVVLVGVWMVVGGVVMGVSMRNSSDAVTLMNQINGYKTAVTAFDLKYDCYPGDCANITDTLPADPNCVGRRSALAVSNGLTCNGDGNRNIDGTYDVEDNLFWQHLSLAGYIKDGPFTGTCAYAGSDCATNADSWSRINAPMYPMHRNGIIRMLNPDQRYPNSFYTNWFVPQNMEHVFYLVGFNGQDGNGNTIALGYGGISLSRNETLLLDKKYDDGSPATGTITGGYAGVIGLGNTVTANSCYDGSKNPPAYYPYSDSVSGNSLGWPNGGCAPMIKAGF